MDLEAFLLSGHQNIPDLKVHDLIQESAKLAGALAYLHKGLDGDIPGLSCWHMDLKPENILVFHGDTPEFPKVGKWKISDFGISIITGPKETGTIVTVTEFVDALTQRQKAMRPPGPYQPPDGDSFGPRSDVWSLGCILTRVLALGLEGGTGLTQLDELRKTDVDGVSLYENDYFYRGSPAVLNPHIQDWLDRLPHHHANYNFEFLGGCRSLILSMLEIDQEARPYAYEVQEQLHKLMNNAQRTLSCYSRSADTDGHAGSIGLDSVDSESSKRKVEYLMHAIDLGDLEEAGSWLRQGVNVEEKDERPERPLINAIQTGFVQAVELLLDHRRDLDLETPNSAGDTPLKIAAESGNTELVKILLTAGAIVDNPSRRGFTPLMSACRHGHEPAVQALLSRAANCSLHSHDGYTSLHYATFSRDGAKIIKLLSERLTSLGIPRDIPKADNGETPLLTLSKNYADTPFWWKMLDALLKGGIDINKADMNGTTPLYYAVGRECSKLVARLVSEGARWERNSLPSHLSSDMNKALKGTALKVMNPRRNSQGSYGSSRKSLSSQLRRMSTFRS
jgi:ankyrin repeat protein